MLSFLGGGNQRVSIDLDKKGHFLQAYLRVRKVCWVSKSEGPTRITQTCALQIVLAARPRSAVKLSDFRLQEASIPTPGDAGHGSLFEFHDSFVRQAALFLDSAAISQQGVLGSCHRSCLESF